MADEITRDELDPLVVKAWVAATLADPDKLHAIRGNLLLAVCRDYMRLLDVASRSAGLEGRLREAIGRWRARWKAWEASIREQPDHSLKIDYMGEANHCRAMVEELESILACSRILAEPTDAK